MEKDIPLHLQEIIFTSKKLSRQIAKWERQRMIKKIAPRLYTGKLDLQPETLIQRNLFLILGRHYPNAVISHRSAMELKPTETNDFFLTYTYTKKIPLPGVT